MAKKAQKPAKKAAKRPAKASADVIVDTLAAVARHFKVSYDIVQRQWRTAGMPVEPDGKFNLTKIEDWQSTRKSRRRNSLDGPEAEASSAVRRRKDEFEAQIKEQELLLRTHRNQVLLGDYVIRGDVERFIAAFLTLLRDEAERVHLEIKATLPKEHRDEISDTLQRRLQLMLSTLHRQKAKVSELVRAEMPR
jgi:hypothetical protein